MFVAVLLAVSVNAFSQGTAITSTTLSAAIADERTTRLTVASATGFTASSDTLDYGVFIDHEFMRITAVSGTTITVMRAQASTNAQRHRSGARAYVGLYGSSAASGTQVGGPFIQTPMQGSCTRTQYPRMPLIQVNANALGGQAFYNCLGGQWYKQTLLDDELAQTGGATQPKYCTIPIGSVAYGSLGTSTTFVNGTVYVASVFVPQTMLVTGVSTLVNGTVGTNNFLAAIYDATGALLANSAVAGAVTAGANTFNDRALTAAFVLTGPARYFIGVQGNGTTDGIRTVAVSTFIDLTGNSRTGTFGTLPAITVPTTLTADTAPISCLY